MPESRGWAKWAAPINDGGAPSEAGAERAEQDQLARLQAPGFLHVRKRERQRRRRRVAVLRDAVDDAVGGQVESLADGAEDPAVGLVVDEQVDVVQARAGRADRLHGGQRKPGDRLAEGLVAAHADRPLGARDDDVVGARAVRAEHDRPNAAVSLSRRLQHHRAGAVGEHGGGCAIVGIGDPRHEVGADHQHALRSASLDLTGADRQRRQEAGARRADVERAGTHRAELVGNLSGAAFGMTSSGVVVATSTRSTCSGATPARRSAAVAAFVACVASRSLGSATWRE